MKFISFTFCLFISLSVLSQTSAKTNDGRDIIIEDNGTWHYSNGNNTQQVASSDCEKYMVGDISIRNASNVPLMGQVTYTIWSRGKGQGTKFYPRQDFTLNPGEELKIRDVMEDNFSYYTVKQTPDPTNVDQPMWNISTRKDGSNYVQRCKVSYVNLK